jgi:hypothetical protein
MKNLVDKLLDKITYIDPVHGPSLNLGIAAAVVACCYLFAALLEKL